MKKCFRVKKVEIEDRHFSCPEPFFRVRVDFCIVDEHGIESNTGWAEKGCNTWTDVDYFIHRWR